MYTTSVKINFFDADPAGVLFFGNLFRLVHLSYEKMLLDGNMEMDYFFNEEYLIPIIHTEADFRKPVYPGNELQVEIFVSVLRKSSFELSYKFMNTEGDILAEAKTVHVFILKGTWEKTALPAELSNYLKKHSNNPPN